MYDFHGSFLSISKILPSKGSGGGPGGKGLFVELPLPLLLCHKPKDATPRARRDAMARPGNPISMPMAVADKNAVGEEAPFYAVNSLYAQTVRIGNSRLS